MKCKKCKFFFVTDELCSVCGKDKQTKGDGHGKGKVRLERLKK